MEILENITVPTGSILIVNGERGKLECLSIGDYGKYVNIKADFLGLDRNIQEVKHTQLMPLSKKWVITISTQYGCPMNCTFCDVPKVGVGINATINDLSGQIECGLSMHPEIEYTDRLNIHYARMGEPTFNPEVCQHASCLKEELADRLGDSLIHPVVSTMMPKKNKDLREFLETWIDIKNNVFYGNAGLQLSINSTNNAEREQMFSGNALTIEEISSLAQKWEVPSGRKYTLNFAVAGYEIDANKLRKLFNPEKFIVKLTPMHKTTTALQHGIKTEGDYTTFYPYNKNEQELKKAGFDVLVFIASLEEDLGRITCGNAILSGTKPEVSNSVVYYK